LSKDYLYPTPADQVVNLDLAEKQGHYTIRLVNTLGQVLLEE